MCTSASPCGGSVEGLDDGRLSFRGALDGSFNRFVQKSGVYDLALAVDADGRLVASNRVWPDGTPFAEELLEGLGGLERWPEKVRLMQQNWIGKSTGARLRFALADRAGAVEVFTTRPDTLFGASFVALAPDHPLSSELARERPELAEFVRACLRGGTSEAEIETQEKLGFATGLSCRHPFLPDTLLPVYVANFVLMDYGTGAIFGCPAHDQRDLDFARKYGLPVRPVVLPPDADAATFEVGGEAYVGDGVLSNSGFLDGLGVEAAKARAIAELRRLGLGEGETTWRLRDWGVSRQRYWGCPIPVVYCDACGAVPVPEDQLPVLLPEDVEDAFASGDVHSPIKSDPQWRKTTCPQCGKPAERETDTFDTFMESSWYYARYTSPGATDMVDARAKYWTPVDQYIGGIEHAILHLLYFRFYHKLLRDEGLVDSDEPATNLLCQGMVIAETFYRDNADGSKDWINPADVEIERDDKGRIVGAKSKADGAPVRIGHVEKMSKSKNNGVDPQAMVDKYGADTVRLFSMFAAPPEQSLEWNEAGVEGMSRFLRRFWREVTTHASQPDHPDVDVSALNAAQKTLRRQLHEAIQKVGDDYGRRYSFNTAIAALMELLNHVSKFDDMSEQGRAVRHEALQAMVLLLNPVTPHVSHHLWQVLGHPETLLEDVPFPQADPAALVRDAVTLAVQVNGKLRGTIEVGVQAAKAEVEALALAEPNVVKFMEGMAVKKIIVVPGKIVNIVAG